jgi:hypothetical protein
MNKIADYNVDKSDKVVLSEIIEKLDPYIEGKLPEWSGARQAYREAKIGEEFGSWLPLNKNLSPNVLRTAAALSMVAKGASEGKILPILGAGMVSPRVWGAGIQYAGPVSKVGIRAGTYALDPLNLAQDSETDLIRKYYAQEK